MSDSLDIIKSFIALVDDSEGIAGYHLNGEVGEWEDSDFIEEARELVENRDKEEASCYTLEMVTEDDSKTLPAFFGSEESARKFVKESPMTFMLHNEVWLKHSVRVADKESINNALGITNVFREDKNHL